MAEDSDYLFILQEVCKYFSSDYIEDCKKIIKFILKTTGDNKSCAINNTELWNSNNSTRSISSIQIMLQVYKQLIIGPKKQTDLFLFKPIFSFITEELQNFELDTNYLDIKFEKSLLETIHLLLEIAFLQNCEDNIRELANFHLSTVTYISKCLSCTKNFSSAQLIFRLKMICVIYEVIYFYENESQYKNVAQIQNLLKIFDDQCNFKEHQIFTHILIYGTDDISIFTLINVIPQYIKSLKSVDIIADIWKQVSNLMNSKVESSCYSRVFMIWCYLFNLCFVEKAVVYPEELMNIILTDENYWHLIKFGLSANDGLSRKQAMYLLTKTVDLLEISNEKFFCYEKKGAIVWWDSNLKCLFSDIYKNLIIILEYFDEQQYHIIKPMFQLVEKFIKIIQQQLPKEKSLDLSWLYLIHKRALTHESLQVVKWGLFNLLRLPVQIFSDIVAVETTVDLLVPVLNNISIYYNDGLTINKELEAFFNNLIQMKLSKSFFNYLIRKICRTTWSPESLFFVVNALSSVSKQFFWEENEILEIKTFVAKAFRTHSRILQAGIQYKLLLSIINLTNVKCVKLENIVLLLSSFCNLEFSGKGQKVWEDIVVWLRNCYSEKEAENCLNKYIFINLGVEGNQKPAALMFFLFFDVYQTKVGSNSDSSFVLNHLHKILFSFKNIENRLYCNNSLLNSYLSILSCIMDESFKRFNEEESILMYILPFCDNIVSYINMQIKEIFKLEHYSIATLYVKCFENLLKCHYFYKIDLGNTKKIYSELFKQLKTSEGKTLTMPSLQLYCLMQLLKFSIKYSTLDTESERLLSMHLKVYVNEPLGKEYFEEKTKDLKVLWGRINADYLESKWYILENFLKKNIGTYEFKMIETICAQALSIGGYGVLCPVMSILKNILPKYKDDKIQEIVDLIWQLIMERRKTDEFKALVKLFVEMLFQEELIKFDNTNIFRKYIDLIFSDSSLAVVTIFIKHIQQIQLQSIASSLYVYILARGLVYGHIQKKDERLTNQVCSFIQDFKIFEFSECRSSNEVRGRSVQMILRLNKANNSHCKIAIELMEELINLEKEVNKKKIRYFGDSYVHRVKHRLLQALLLLQPFLSKEESSSRLLLEWSYNSLTSENPQPSVKYQLEWLLVRILLKNHTFLNEFWKIFNCDVEIKTKGVCSLITVLFHICKLVPAHLFSSWISQALVTLLPFCMDQHFEIRLYAQVVTEKLYGLAKSRNLQKIIQKHEVLYECVSQSIQRGCKGNTGKNCFKLKEDFYLNEFHPFGHYSLQSIYVDLPRLSNVCNDEWISVELFQKCGVELNNSNICLKSLFNPLEKVECAKWLCEKSTAADKLEVNEEFLIENYQKKMIPLKPLIPMVNEISDGVEKFGQGRIKIDGLVVVASLIDRIPNLGGLARTCEIFGVSEYIVESIKFIEDKQFTSLSVTAEKWVTIKEVKLQNLLNYILEMKKNGYIIVGAEQALHSLPLSEVKFPKKSLFLLGNEKKGIPPNLIPLLDICVEIPQIGVIRSLNVHVTGALFIWEYAKQNFFTR